VKRTSQKLNEAEFFLTKLDEHYFDHVQGIVKESPASPAFAYNLSAFLSAARSVTWVMRHECTSIDGWEEWFESQKVSETHRTLLKVFNNLRIRTNKLEPIELGHSIRFVGDPGSKERDPRMPRIKVSISTADEEEKVIQSGEVAEFIWTSDEFDGEDLLQPCKEYFDLLKHLVENCTLKFGKG